MFQHHLLLLLLPWLITLVCWEVRGHRVSQPVPREGMLGRKMAGGRCWR